MKLFHFIGGIFAMLLSIILFAFRATYKWVCTKLRQAQSTLRLARAHNRSTRVRLQWLNARILARGGLAALWMLLFCVALLTGPNVRAQLTNINYPNYQSGQPNFFYADPNYSNYAVSNSAAQSWTPGATNAYIKTIRQNQGLGLFLAVWSTNNNGNINSVTNYTVKFDVTGDGSTWTAGNGAQPITWTVSLAGKIPGTNVFWTNLPATTLSNVRKIQCTSASTTASNEVYAALGYSQSTQ